LGGQRELRWHEPEWHVASIRPVREPTRAHWGYPDTDSNCISIRNGYRDPDCNGDGHIHPYGDCDIDTDCHCYGYGNANRDSNDDTEAYSVTKTHAIGTSSSHTGAASLIENSSFEKSN
jgi:hypothetical protein